MASILIHTSTGVPFFLAQRFDRIQMRNYGGPSPRNAVHLIGPRSRLLARFSRRHPEIAGFTKTTNDLGSRNLAESRSQLEQDIFNPKGPLSRDCVSVGMWTF